MASNGTPLHLLEFLLQLLDGGVRALQIFVESVSFRNQLLLPGAESLLFDFDLLRESLPESFFLLLELGVVQFSRSGLSEFPRLHLLGPVGFVVVLLGGVDQVEHVCPDEDGSQLLEIAVIFVLDFGHAPGILSTLDDTTVGRLDVLLTADDSERHGGHEGASVLRRRFIVILDGWLINLDALCLDDILDPMLKPGQIGRGERVRLGDDGNQVHPGAEALHDLDVERLQSVAGGANEIQAGMNSEVNLVLPAWLLLLQHVGLVLVVKEFNNGHPRVAVVDIVTEPGRIDDREPNCPGQRLSILS